MVKYLYSGDNMEKIIFLGTGHAGVIDNFNSSFVLEDQNGDYLLVDAGGGNGILKQLKNANVDLLNIHNIFITHKHIDHMLGVIWLYRMIDSAMNNGMYEGILNIYCNEEVASLITFMINNFLRKSQQKNFDRRIFINSVNDKERVRILDYDIEFFDINSIIDKQLGFRTVLNNGKTLVMSGDEPLDDKLFGYARNCDYLIHEAFCLEEESGIFKPREKNHDTVALAAVKAEKLGVRNLILWHTCDNLKSDRANKYTVEAIKYYNGNVYVPNDLDIINL